MPSVLDGINFLLCKSGIFCQVIQSNMIKEGGGAIEGVLLYNKRTILVLQAVNYEKYAIKTVDKTEQMFYSLNRTFVPW